MGGFSHSVTTTQRHSKYSDVLHIFIFTEYFTGGYVNPVDYSYCDVQCNMHDIIVINTINEMEHKYH